MYPLFIWSEPRANCQRPLESVDQPLERPRLTAMDSHGKVLLDRLIRLPGRRLAAGPGVLHTSKNTGRRGFVRGVARRRLGGWSAGGSPAGARQKPPP